MSFDRWMQRDARYAEAIAKQAADHGYQVVLTTPEKNAEDLYCEVLDALEGPAV